MSSDKAGNFRTCQLNRQWSGQTPTCIRTFNAILFL